MNCRGRYEDISVTEQFEFHDINTDILNEFVLAISCFVYYAFKVTLK